MSSSSQGRFRKKSNSRNPSTKDEKVSGRTSNQREEPILNIQKILAEREQREMERRCFSDLESPTLPSFLSDSQMLELSQDSSQPTTTKLRNNGLVEMEVFHKNQVFRLFREERLNFSWIQKCNSSSEAYIRDLPKMDHSQLLQYLRGEFPVTLLRRSPPTKKLACRYLFLLMSVSDNERIMEACCEMLFECIASPVKPFSVPVPDLVAVFMNYGALKSKLWPSEPKLTFPYGIRDSVLDSFEAKADCNHSFPYRNLKMVLETLRFNLQSYPCFTESEKVGLFRLMLTLATANAIVCEWDFVTEPLIPTIKQIINLILSSFTQEEWCERSFTKVEDLAEASWLTDVDHPGIVQRIQCIPITTMRGIQVQQSAAHFAVQNLMDFETVHLLGKVTIGDVVKLVESVISKRCTDYGLAYSCVVLISLCIDLDNPTLDQEMLKEVARMMADWKHSIRDMANDMDENRLAIKNLLTELHTMWSDSFAEVDHVV